ncbi:hypothetical protein Tco_0737245 [Tanacetum coccineum]
MLHSRTKHIDIKYHFIRNHILKRDTKLYFVPIELQLADIYTKPLAEPNFTRLVAELGMLNIEKDVSDKKNALIPPCDCKKERKSNICFTRYLSLVLEHPLGDAYINENLKTFKPYHITASSFKPTFENKVPLTAHMCKVAKLSPEPIKSLIQPSRDVITDDIAGKSSSKTFAQLESTSTPQVTDTQHAGETVTTADAT